MGKPRTSFSRIEIRLLGPFDVRLGTAPLPPLRSRKGQHLLALLALRQPREVQREWLAANLWPESDSENAYYNLRRTLVGLRSVLGPARDCLLSPTPHSLCLITDACVEVDVASFDALLRKGDPLSLQAAIELYRGPLLEGWSEEWILVEREARQQACLQALDRLAAKATQQQDWAEAARRLKRMVVLEPFQEEVQRRLIEVLAQNGDYAAATLVYRELRLLLHRELNAEPSLETTALFQKIREETRQHTNRPRLSSSPAPDSCLSHRLPQPLSTLIGREAEIEQVKTLLSHAPLVTLTGTGGVGKTRLALRVAEEVAHDSPDDVWFVDLTAIQDETLLPKVITAALGVKEAAGRSPLQTLLNYLRPRKLLLVLDNCEHLIQGCAQLVQMLLRECPSLCILATSRQPLELGSEKSFRVPSLSLPDLEESKKDKEEATTTVLCSEAGRLFVERTKEALRTFSLTKDNARAVAHLCRRLDGIPLALELAAACVRGMTVTQIVQRFDARLRLLKSRDPSTPTRHQTLRSMLDWSYELLTEPERVLLCRLAVFSGGCTIEAAETICSGEGVDELEVLDLLLKLLDKSLVVYEEQNGESRYLLLETVRQYGVERLEERGELDAIRERHRDYFLALAEEAEPQLLSAQQTYWLDRLEREHNNFRAVLRWSVEGAARLRLAGALGRFWYLHSHFSEGRGWLEGGLTREDTHQDSGIRAKALIAAARITLRQGDYGMTRQWSEELLTHSIERNYRRGMADAWNMLGILTVIQGDYPEARRLYEQSLALNRELKDKNGTSLVCSNLGNLSHLQGDYEQACICYEESLQLSKEIGDARGVALVCGNLGVVLECMGRTAEGQAMYEESLKQMRSLGDRWGVAYALNSLVAIHRNRGDLATARAFCEESLAIRREIGDSHGIAYSLDNLSQITQYEGDFARAYALYQESLDILRQLEERWGIAAMLNGLGNVALLRGHLEESRLHLEESLAIRQEMGERRGIARTQHSLGYLALMLGNFSEAHHLLRESLHMHADLGNKGGVAEALHLFGCLSVKQEAEGWATRAARLFGAEARLREEMGGLLSPLEQPLHEPCWNAARATLGDTAFDAAIAEGRALTMEQAIALAFEE